MAAGRRLARRQHLGIFKLFGAATAHTHQVMVVAMGITGQLKAASPFGQLQLLQQAHGAEQPQGAIHRGQRNPGLGSQQALMHLLGAEMTALAQALKQPQHPLALGGEPLAAIMQAGPEPIGAGLDQLRRRSLEYAGRLSLEGKTSRGGSLGGGGHQDFHSTSQQ